MSVRACCPECQTSYDLPDRFGGKRVRCRECGCEFPVATPAAAESAEPESDIQSESRRVPPLRAEREEKDESRKGRRRHDDEEDEDRPRRRSAGAAARRRRSQGTSAGLIVGAIVGGLLVLTCGCGGLVYLLMPAGFSDLPDDAAAEAPVADLPVNDAPAAAWNNPPPPGPALFPEQPPPAADRDDGHAPAPVLIPPPPRVDIRAPVLAGDRVEVPLPAPVADVAVGGAGRFLVLHLPQRQQLAVFDANEARVVKSIPVADSVKFAAGMDKLVVVRPADGAVERWSLLTFTREATGSLKMKVPPVAVAMGSASNGPLVVSGVDWPRLGETAFFDVLTMTRVEMSFDPHNFFNTSPDVFLRASADGRAFACAPDGPGGNTLMCTWSAGRVRKFVGAGGSFPVPGPDGRAVYTGNGICTVEQRPIAAVGAHCVPAHHGPYYLALPRADGGAGKRTVSVHLEGDGRAFAFLADLDLLAGPAGNQDHLTPDRRVHLIPDAKLLVTIPPGNDRLVLRPFDAERVLEASGLTDYLLVTSRAPTAAVRGKDYVYQLAVKSKKGGLSYQVFSGPPGARIDPAGKFTWPVPAAFADHEADVLVAVRDAGGHEVRHGFRLDVPRGR